jgi:hypothetical protein
MSQDLKTTRKLLPSAARTATTATSVQYSDPSQKYIRLYLNITAASGTGGLSPKIRGYDPISGNAVELSTGGTAVTATGTYCYEFMSSAATAAGNVKECLSRMLPMKWDVSVAHGDSSSYTYSLSCEVFPEG